MGFKDAMRSLKDNTFGNAKFTYEKDCEEFRFRYLCDLDSHIDVLGKFLDKDAHIIQFSEDVFPKVVKLANDLFFTDPHGAVYTVDADTVRVEEIDVQLSTKVEKHTVTTVHYTPRTLRLE